MSTISSSIQMEESLNKFLNRFFSFNHSAGIGLPGVAASGTIAANTIVDASVQLKLMEDLKKRGALQ